MPIAYIDESQMRGTGSGGIYFLGATILETMKFAPEMRDMLVRLKPKAQTKLHWYDAIKSLRVRTMDLISTFDVDHLVVEHGATTGEATERSRRCCIERMMHELKGFGVDHVVFESRGLADDRRDMQMLDSLRAKRQVQGVRFDHVLGNSEPMLWVPDAVLGAIESVRLDQPEYLSAIEHRLLVFPTSD